MADLIQADSLAEAWLGAIELLLARGDKSFAFLAHVVL